MLTEEKLKGAILQRNKLICLMKLVIKHLLVNLRAKKKQRTRLALLPNSEKELSAGLESRGEAPKEKQSSFEKSVMDSPFFKKKSPMKMNYFKNET